MNRLSNEQSAYLRSAAHQPVHWFAWGEDGFEAARREKKPILLDVGAVWCHWCHVMDMESYENAEIAKIINEHFIAVKVDRDERPDVDARYQAAVSAISGQGGWPLTAFLLPDGRVFYGGTYFPPEDRYGRPGFPKVLLALSDAFKNDSTKVYQNADQVANFVVQYLSKSSRVGELNSALVDSALTSISQAHDVRYGGFGNAPKFSHTGAIELLLQRFHAVGEKWMIEAVTRTLKAMARGGIYDQLGGGFHRYSTDAKWIVPHFEKMLYDNAPILVNYVHAYQATGDNSFKDVALDIIRYVDEVLTDHEQGGFYASQDADVVLGDDGSYFTWTMEDAKKELSADEFSVLQLYYNIHEEGEMHHDPLQNVLFIDKDLDQIADITHKRIGDVRKLLNEGRSKLQQARSRRKAPYVDTTVYAAWNSMMISAYLQAYKAFELTNIKGVALKAMERILRGYRLPEGLISHRAVSIATEAFLDDQVETVNALLSCYEATSEQHYLEHAESIMTKTIESFWDDDEELKHGSSAFNDCPSLHVTIGALNIKNKPITDSPTPGANAVAALTLLKLYAITEKEQYRNLAEKILIYFSGGMTEQGVFAATYFLALDRYLTPSPHVIVVSSKKDPAGQELLQTAKSVYYPHKVVSFVDPLVTTHVPPSVSAMIAAYSKPVAYICSNRVCGPPAYSAEQLRNSLNSFAGATQ